MTLQQRIGRSVVRRNRKLLKRLPSLEIIEPRVLLAAGPGFVQGFDLNSSNVGIPNATVTLTNTSNNQSISTMTNGVGYYAFNGVAPGTYDVTQTAANYVQSGVDIQTTVNPASALPDNGGIQVTVLNLGVPQPITATWATNPYSPGSYQNTNISINAPGFQTPALETYNKQLTGQLGVTLSGNQGNVTSILSLCTDLIEGIDIPPPASSFTAQPGLAPAPGTSAASALQTNIGEIGYLYNTYGQSLQGATPAAQAINGAAVQLALWALLYNDVAYPTSVNGDPSVTNGQNFQVLSSTNPAIVSQADSYLASAAANSPEDAYILNVAKGTSRGGQAMISTDLLNFTNAQLFQPSINTAAAVSTPATVGIASLQDEATVSGGYLPGGTIQFSLTSPDGSTVSIGSPVTVNGDGTYDSVTVTATEAGNYQWHASYSGDSNNSPASDQGGALEGVATTKACPSINTAATVSTPATVGIASLQDEATVSGGYLPGGTIQFSLTSPDGSTVSIGSPVTVNGDGTYDSVTVTATEAGNYQWHASYSGDSNNSPASDQGGALEGVATTKACPSINTAATESTPATVGIASLQDEATVSGGYLPGGTIQFSLTSPDGSTVSIGSPVTVNGDGTYDSVTVTATEAGNYQWHASYSGDSNNSPASDQGGALEGVATTKACPSINTAATVSTPATVGIASLQDEATVSGGYLPGGTIQFSLTSPDGSTVSIGSPVTVNGDGTYDSVTVTATEAGNYQWHASYSGDSNNSPASDQGGALEGVATTKACPSINTAATESTPATVGIASLQDEATVSGGYLPGGTIQFSLTSPDGSTVSIGSPVTVNGDGTYDSVTVTATEAGNYQWHASYSGDSNNSPASDQGGALEGVATTKACPSINTAATVSTPATVGIASLQDEATVSGGYLPGGTIQFSLTSPDGSTVNIGSPVTVNGDGTYDSVTVTATEAGNYQWHASYSGDSNNSPASDQGGALEGVATTKACPSIATTASGTAGDVVGNSYLSDSAVLSGGDSETGKITFTLKAPDGSTQTETVAVNGPNTYTTPTPVLATQVGTYTWSASYAGDGLNNGTIDNGKNESVCIVASSPSIVTTPNPTVVTIGTSCGPLTDSATLSGGSNPGGSITFTLYAPGCKTPVDTETVSVNGDKTYTTPKGYTLPSNPTPGVYQWDATYSGDSKNAMATDAGNTWEQVQVVTPCCNLSNISFTVNDNGTVTHPTDLGGNTQQGDTVIANFTVPAGYYDQLTLVTYTAPESSYNADDANLQTVVSVATGFFGPGAHTLGPVTIPGSFYQIDFVCGSVITTLGPAGSNNFYSAQNRLISHDNGGVNPVGLPELEIQGTVFFDSNDNGVEGSGDSGLANVTVNLTGTDAYGNHVSISTQTNSSGAYTFAGMPISNSAGYTVTPVVPSGYTAGIATAGKVNPTTVDGTASSSPESVVGVLMQTSSQTNGTGYNFGMVKPISLSGEVYTDLNGDGKLESGDTGLNGVTITLYNSSGAKVTSTTTSGSGSSAGGYSFTNLAPGTYSVVETILNNYVGTGSDVGSVGGTSVSATDIGSIALGTGQSGVSYNFGEAQPVCISGKVFTDSSNNCNSSQAGLNGVTVTLENSSGKVVASTVTSGSGSSAGSYSFTNLAPGTYTLVETVLSGYSATGTDIGSAGGSSAGSTQINGITLGSGSSASGYDFGQKKKS